MFKKVNLQPQLISCPYQCRSPMNHSIGVDCMKSTIEQQEQSNKMRVVVK